MKSILPLLVFCFITTLNYGQETTDLAIASCCEDGRGCTGSAYCSACKNCSGCRHCSKNGGSCGVCSGGSIKKYKSSYSNSSSIQKSSNIIKFSIGDDLVVVSATLNLREGPGTKFQILEKLTTGTYLNLLDIKNKWLKVEVERTKTIGFVYFKYVKISK